MTRCDCCRKDNPECENCKNVFDKKEKIICTEDGHFCDGECYVEYFELERAEVE
jgi:hypothetical protein